MSSENKQTKRDAEQADQQAIERPAQEVVQQSDQQSIKQPAQQADQQKSLSSGGKATFNVVCNQKPTTNRKHKYLVSCSVCDLQFFHDYGDEHDFYCYECKRKGLHKPQ